MALMCPVGFLLGYGFAKVVIGADARTARTVSMETGIQQVGIAGAIAIQTFKGQALDKAIATICAETNPWSRQNHLQLRPYFRTGHDRGLRDFHGRVRPAVERHPALRLRRAARGRKGPGETALRRPEPGGYHSIATSTRTRPHYICVKVACVHIIDTTIKLHAAPGP